MPPCAFTHFAHASIAAPLSPSELCSAPVQLQIIPSVNEPCEADRFAAAPVVALVIDWEPHALTAHTTAKSATAARYRLETTCIRAAESVSRAGLESGTPDRFALPFRGRVREGAGALAALGVETAARDRLRVS